MKKALSYPELWKQKQRELPVKGNPDEQWLRMQALLDQRMPVSGTLKKPARFKLPKWGLKVLAGITAAGALYLGSRLYVAKNNHEPAKPAVQQIRRDSLAPAANHTSPAGGAVNPAAGNGSPGGRPVVAGGNHVVNGETKAINDISKRERPTIDSIQAPAMLNLPVHRDSMLLPMEAVPFKQVRDSAGAVILEKKDIPKDTSNTVKKTPKKKRRSKVSVFF
jgi:hypothetical protein